MGYRRLLKDYMAHINSVVGSDLVELAGLTQAFSRRELGELRTIVAELKREGYAEHEPQNYNHLVRALIEAGIVSLDEIASAEKFEETLIESPVTEDVVRQTLLEATRRQH